MRLFGLIGYPLSHSFSKKYFTEKFEQEELTDCRYKLFPLEAIDQLPALLQDNQDLKGLNVTIPYKIQVLSYLDSTEHIPGALNACNCIRISQGKLFGYNTDWAGFEQSLSPLLQSHHKRALILGNGGATAAVSYALKKIGIEFDIVSRTLHGGSTLTYEDLDEKVIRQNTLIINTTPLGMYPTINTCPDIPYHFITDAHLLYDLLYNPSKTLFLQKGEERGATIKNGEEMLMLQAEGSWNIWNSV
ncbi:MAG: shikimate dehydrogenase [Bacteroidota bacterium]|nr:shikimate dehydrogenase [Bacteroidota bacterium]